MDKERQYGGGTPPAVPKSHQKTPSPKASRTSWEATRDEPMEYAWDAWPRPPAGTCPQDLLREAAEEQHGAGDVSEAGDEPLVPDVLQLQAVLAALGDLLVLQHLVEDLVRQGEVVTLLWQSHQLLGTARGWHWGLV